jgi:hypothetical protein
MMGARRLLGLWWRKDRQLLESYAEGLEQGFQIAQTIVGCEIDKIRCIVATDQDEASRLIHRKLGLEHVDGVLREYSHDRWRPFWNGPWHLKYENEPLPPKTEDINGH